MKKDEERRKKDKRKDERKTKDFFFVREFIVLTMTTAAMCSMSINSLDVWERVTLGLAEI